MLKLGNDIVDLATSYAKDKYLKQRFLNRVFTAEEQLSILKISSEANKSKMLWSIWAAKEAAYKACKKKFPEIIFSHHKFATDYNTLIDLHLRLSNNSSCNINHRKFAKVYGFLKYKEEVISLEWQYNQDNVHAIAVLLDNKERFNNWSKINSNITKRTVMVDVLAYLGFFKYIKKYFTSRELSLTFSKESLITRFYAKKFLRSSYGFAKDLEIIRSNGNPPALFIKGNKLSEHEISLSHDGSFMAVCCC